MISETLEQYLLSRLDEHVDDLDFEDIKEMEEFKELMIEQITEGADLIEICSLMEITKAKVLEYFPEEIIRESMMEIYGYAEYEH